MKIHPCVRIVLPAMLVWLGWAAGAVAQGNAAAVAAQEEAEERYRRLSAQVTSLRETQEYHHQQIAAIEKAVRDLSDQVAKLSNAVNSSPHQESVRQLSDQIKKVDEARVAENKRIFDTIDEMNRLLKGLASAPPPRPPSARAETRSGAGAANPNEEGFEYVVQKGDTLSGIVQAYRQQNIKVTSKAVQEANPAVNWDRLRVGQKVFIPKPRN